MTRADPNDSNWYPGGMLPGTEIQQVSDAANLHLNPDCRDLPDDAEDRGIEAAALPPSHREGSRCKTCWSPERLVGGEWPSDATAANSPVEEARQRRQEGGSQQTLVDSVTATDGGQR